MTQSAIWKIENPDKETGRRRRITLDEAVTFARVFEVSVEELSAPRAAQEANEAAHLGRSIVGQMKGIKAMSKNMADDVVRLLKLIEHAEDERLLWSALSVGLKEAESTDPWYSTTFGSEVVQKRAYTSDQSAIVTAWIDRLDAWIEGWTPFIEGLPLPDEEDV